MHHDGFDWDAGNRDKCQKRGVSVAEIEELFRRRIIILPDHDHSQHENRSRAIGRDIRGRSIFVVFTIRQIGASTLIRPLSARFMHRKEVAAYEKAYPDF